MSASNFKFVTHDKFESERIAAPHYSYWKSVGRAFFSKKITVFLLIVVVVLSLIALIQPILSGYDPQVVPNINDASMRFQGPSAQYPFGTDDVGNSVWDVVWAGTKTSITIGFVVTFVNVVIGVIVGGIWGISKSLDKFMIEVYNIINSVPYILIVTVLMYMLGRGFWQLIFAMCLTGWLGVAYFIRTQVMIIRDREYNLASKCLGTPRLRLVTKNILPYQLSVIMTIVSREIPSAISTEVFLSYLGIGLKTDVPSLGRMLSKYANYFNGYPHLFWAPVIVLAIISVSLYVIGQALADAADPRTHM
ncbi:MAG TPA: ABC transporter permease [Firmicutes bacterium]|nr:ABC transporter permease [Bacillota bacterium]